MAACYFKHSACQERTRANEVYDCEETPYIHHIVDEVAATGAHGRPAASMGAPRYNVSLWWKYATDHADSGGSA